MGGDDKKVFSHPHYYIIYFENNFSLKTTNTAAIAGVAKLKK